MNQVRPMPKSPRYDRPEISLIEERLEPYGIAVYVGGREGMSNLPLLRKHNITTVVNCAVNLDINVVDTPDPAVEEGHHFGREADRQGSVSAPRCPRTWAEGPRRGSTPSTS